MKKLTNRSFIDILRVPQQKNVEVLGMTNMKKMMKVSALALFALVLSGCGSDDIESGQALPSCNVPDFLNDAGVCEAPPPIFCPAPTIPNETNDACVVGFNPDLPLPEVFPEDNQAVLYYNRADVDATNTPNDPAYEGWRLHTWSNDACMAYADPDTPWPDGRVHDGIDPTYGAYWVLDLVEGYADTEGACHNFIIHIGTEDSGKEMGGGDFRGSLTQDDERFTRMNFTLSGVAEVFEFPIDSLGEQPVAVEGTQAHWLDAETILWNVDDTVVDSVKLHFSATADMEITLEDGIINSTALDLVPVDLTDEQIAIAPHLAGLTAFAGAWEADDAKEVLKAQVLAGAYDADGKLVAATRLQIPKVIDQLYTTGENDANEAALGPIYTDNGITAAVWAPTAQNVSLKLYNDNKTLASTTPMTLDPVSGVWSFDGTMDMDRQLYRYEVTVYSPVNDQIEVLDVTDPYSVSLALNGRFSQFVNLNDADLKPADWDSHTIPLVENFEDIVIIEGHIREFSIRDESTMAENRGKYKAFSQLDSVPMLHLKSLAEAGLTHFHVLPANDIATTNEDDARTIDWTSTLQEFCSLSPGAEVCGDGSDLTMTIAEKYESFDVLTQQGAAANLTEQLRNFDQFNWGYDPKHFNTPDGGYASDPDGVARIIEMREMIKGLHDIGLRVALDVVYNHTNASGLNQNSVFDQVVPGYYHRYTIAEGNIVRETCCDDTEPRNIMMEKFMEDSLLLWAEHYKFDSFRFDIMSQASKDTMLDLFEKVKAIDEDTYFYGEGWGKNTSSYGDFEIASQFNMAGSEIGTFNDRFREAIRFDNADSNGGAAINDVYRKTMFTKEADDDAPRIQDVVKMSLAGNIENFVLQTASGVDSPASSLGAYSKDPADSINYLSKHDGNTLFDRMQYVLPSDLDIDERVRAQNVTATLPLMAQGIPFFQIGGDFLRSKSMDRNTYDAGDWFTYTDFTLQDNNWNKGLPPAEDNAFRWELIGSFVNIPERAPSSEDMSFAAEVFKEYLSIRSASSLFRLTTADDIINRVGFHNLGRRQQPGLIAMSLDDSPTAGNGAELLDLDAANDAIVVVINTGYEEKSIDILTAAGFELHPTLASSVDSIVTGASFADSSADGVVQGTFTVPPLTTAVFVKPQGMERGYGLAATATAGAPDVVPFGDSEIYVRGGMNGWEATDAMTYVGNGVYEARITLTGESTVEFKIADIDYNPVNLGNDAGEVIEGMDKVLNYFQGNLAFTPSVDASYLFSLDASDTTAPVLNISNYNPYADRPLFIRGGMNGWSTDDEMVYQGDRIFSVSIDLNAETYGFKVADENYDVVNLGAFTEDAADNQVTLGRETFLAANGSNLFIDIPEADNYTFVFDTVNLEEPKIRVLGGPFFGETEVFVRGSFNSWGTGNPLSYQGNGVYSADISLDASEVFFKVANEGFNTVNLGADNDDEPLVTIGEAKQLRQDSQTNLSVTIPSDGTYKFSVTGPDPATAKVTVTPVE
jgi:pullulanase-type alpha-1,6-glucosidase